MTDHYAVIGNPVAHSLSPRIHAAFAAATGEDLVYTALLAPADGFAAAARAFFAEGGAGLNVTVPFKQEAARWVQHLDPGAAAAAAVNTICRESGGYRGYNTDGRGLLRDLTANCGEAVTGARVLLLGAGGAAGGALRPLLEARPRCLAVANRTRERALALVRSVRAEMPGADVRALALRDVTAGFDLVVNATSAGLGPRPAVAEIDPAVVAGAFCYDMIYSGVGEDGRTAFCRWAADHGARRVTDGLGMLVEQAALAFALWRGVTPATGPVLQLLRSHAV